MEGYCATGQRTQWAVAPLEEEEEEEVYGYSANTWLVIVDVNWYNQGQVLADYWLI